jgi:hypothetical protein
VRKLFELLGRLKYDNRSKTAKCRTKIIAPNDFQIECHRTPFTELHTVTGIRKAQLLILFRLTKRGVTIQATWNEMPFHLV